MMCDCGCASNAIRYTLPAPKRGIYVISLSPACVNCVAPSGVSVELIEPGNILYDEYRRGEFIDGPLQLADWGDSKGAAVVTGMLRDEFVEALSKHLVGVSAKEMGENGVIDDIGAEVILEEMYEDAQVRPRVVEQVEK